MKLLDRFYYPLLGILLSSITVASCDCIGNAAHLGATSNNPSAQGELLLSDEKSEVASETPPEQDLSNNMGSDQLVNTGQEGKNEFGNLLGAFLAKCKALEEKGGVFSDFVKAWTKALDEELQQFHEENGNIFPFKSADDFLTAPDKIFHASLSVKELLVGALENASQKIWKNDAEVQGQVRISECLNDIEKIKNFVTKRKPIKQSVGKNDSA